MIILASASPYRAQILNDAGIEFDAQASTIDERAAETPLIESGQDASDIASVLAEAKAMDVAARNPGAVVIGGDQTMSLDGELLHKPATMEEARYRLLAMSGKTHQLHSALALVRDGQTLWRHLDTANMHVRELSPGFIGRYLAQLGDIALSSVGGYQVEGIGIQLFDNIDGDHFTVIGLPLLPLLHQLRALEAIDG